MIDKVRPTPPATAARTARESIREIVKIGLAPMFKRHGFKKEALGFGRRTGTVAHYFNVQLSQWNRGAEGHFYLNAGVMFDDICLLEGKSPPALAKYDDCHFMVRMEQLDPGMPGFFSVDETTDPNTLAQQIGQAVERSFVVPLEKVSCTHAFEATGWVDLIPWGFPAVYRYVTGDVAQAHRLVQLEADTFADRGCTFQSVASALHLKFTA
jgi:hypothetical protein